MYKADLQTDWLRSLKFNVKGTDNGQFTTVKILRSGQSFGELALCQYDLQIDNISMAGQTDIMSKLCIFIVYGRFKSGAMIFGIVIVHSRQQDKRATAVEGNPKAPLSSIQ